MKIIGLTGPTGAGKGAAAQYLKERGAYLVDADADYRALLKSCEAMRRELQEAFGPLEGPGGEIDTKKLGLIVMKDEEKRKRLNAITHPYVRAKAREAFGQAANRGSRCCVYDAPLLFEAGADKLCDCVLVIAAPAGIRIDRIIKRDTISREYAQDRINAQHTDGFFRAHADYVIENTGSLEQLQEKLDRFLNVADERMEKTDVQKNEPIIL